MAMRPYNVDMDKWFSQETTGRECGPCTACCTWLGIEELKKHTAQKCKHLRNPVYKNKRCGIYASRPGACRDYLCAWRNGFGPDNMRPNESGILVTPYDSESVKGMISYTVNVFDMKKADGKVNDTVASLLTLLGTDEVRLVNIAGKTALFFKDGKVYRCALLPGEGYESLMFAAQDPPIGRYSQESIESIN